jgi:hypothetical protein
MCRRAFRLRASFDSLEFRGQSFGLSAKSQHDSRCIVCRSKTMAPLRYPSSDLGGHSDVEGHNRTNSRLVPLLYPVSAFTRNFVRPGKRRIEFSAVESLPLW